MKKHKSKPLSAFRQYTSLLRPTGLAAFGSIAVLALSGVAEALGLASILPLLNQDEPTMLSILPVLATLTLFLVLSTMLKYLGDSLISRVTTVVEARARRELMERLVKGPWPEVGKLGQGEITAAVMSEATQLSNGTYALLSGAGTLVVVLILFAASAVLTPSLLGLALLFILASALIFRWRLKHVRQNERNLSATTTEIAEEVSSSLGDVKFLRESGSDGEWLSRSQENADLLGRLRRRQIMLPAATRTMVDTVAAVFLAVVVGLALLVQGDITLGLVFVALFYRIIPRVQAVQNQLNTALGQVTWVEKWNTRMAALADRDVREPAAKSVGFRESSLGAAPPGFSLRGVSQHFPGRSSAALCSVDLEIAPGERVAILGPSGSGKTTLLDILLGLFPPSEGTVLIDGEALNDDQWSVFRRSIGIVPQDVPIRRGTLAENIYWDRQADPELLARVVEMAQLDGFVGQLPHGAESHIDSKSVGLSGGQRQRVGLARALYRRPSLLVLDEATSALDMETELALLLAVQDIPWPMTVVVVTHRHAALDFVDRRIDLAAGSIRHNHENMELG
ncbi:ABC transporter ATP-binding protein [Arthrobacter sp. KBS0703]|uniref:ATP-binding cassette domain-containing protein n=1 Tax=Arthrobacter sp. KBS0703 TaxID=1955698 RepID=UPI0009C8ED9F|nr:ABC transporter ATP-binding protein [Arthrobacter sp. KBS0703]TSE14715.1 ABC transporter ATP-binding protein [Arthrobacter sp. KBS0703]